MAEGINIGLEVIAALKEQAPEYYDALVNSLSHGATFADKQLDQAWRIAQSGERGANDRARISAGASRYSTDAGLKAAKMRDKTERYGIDTSRMTDQEKIALQRELGQADIGIRQGELGLGYAAAAAGMHGAYNPFAEADILMGGPQANQVPVFMQRLLDNVQGPAFQAPNGAPAGYNMPNVMASVGVGGNAIQGGVGAQNNALRPALMAGKEIAQRGLHTLAPGSLERMGPVQLAGLKNAIEYSGDPSLPAWNWDSLLDVYKKSGIGQGNPFAA